MRTIKFRNATVTLTLLSDATRLRSLKLATMMRLETLLEDIKLASRDTLLWKTIRSEIKKHRQALRKPDSLTYRMDIVYRNSSLYISEEIHETLGEMGNVASELKKYVDSRLRAHRITLKLNRGITHKKGHVFETLGNVNSKPGQVFEKYVQKKVKELYLDKRPELASKYIGLELEFCAPISESMLALKLFKAGLHKIAQLKADGSLRPMKDETGFELAILFREGSFRQDLKKVCDVLKEVNAITQDRRCGLHVHIDMRRRNKDVVYSNLVACQGVLLGMVDPSRNDNEFCRVVSSRKFPTSFTGDRRERYKTINAAAYYKYKTLEVRMHQGSIDFPEIASWMNLLIKISNHKKKIKAVKRLTSLKRRLKLNNKVYGELVDKSCYWQINGSSNRRGIDVAPATRAYTDFMLNTMGNIGSPNTEAATLANVEPLPYPDEIYEPGLAPSRAGRG